MRCLDIEELKEACKNKTHITWHPDYTYEILGQDLLISNIFEENGVYKISVTTQGEIRFNRSIDINGYGDTSRKPMFILVNKGIKKVSVVVPRNNDGLKKCFWCNVFTEKRGGGMYDVCPKCGR